MLILLGLKYWWGPSLPAFRDEPSPVYPRNLKYAKKNNILV
jgi:hypothetical protein